MNRNGYGFVLPEEANLPDVFIPPRKLRGAMHSDQVRVVASQDDKGRLEGEVTKIIKRGCTSVVGQFCIHGQSSYVQAAGWGQELLVSISQKHQAGAIQGQKVVAEIIEYEPKLKGKVTRVIGTAGLVDVELDSIIAKFGLLTQFTELAKKEAGELASIGVKSSKERRDLRKLSFVTIDGASAQDFDDAIYVRQEAGSYRLWVSIADVSHYVLEGSALDQEAFKRATSAYFPDRCIPMLPPELSNDLCSLVPGKDRLTFTAEIRLSAKGQVLEKTFYRSVIRSQARLTYDWVNRAILKKDREAQGEQPKIIAMLKSAVKLAQILRRQRFARGNIDFDLPEPFFVFGQTGETLDILKADRNFAHFMIEEFMILANEAVASFMNQKKLPFIYRIHEKPDGDKVFALSRLLFNLGIPCKFSSDFHPKEFAQVTQRVQGRPEERLVNHVLLRTMKQANYSAENGGHFGLASPCYTHFTSPIRRYPDLIVHRLLGACLDRAFKKVRTYKKESLAEMASHCSKCERVVMEAEWEVQDLKVAEFMQDKVGREFVGRISRVTRYGLYVELDDFFVSGFLPLEHLEKDYKDSFEWYPEQHQIVGKRSKQILKIGDAIKIIMLEASLSKRQVVFCLTS